MQQHVNEEVDYHCLVIIPKVSPSNSQSIEPTQVVLVSVQPTDIADIVQLMIQDMLRKEHLATLEWL